MLTRYHWLIVWISNQLGQELGRKQERWREIYMEERQWISDSKVTEHRGIIANTTIILSLAKKTGVLAVGNNKTCTNRRSQENDI